MPPKKQPKRVGPSAPAPTSKDVYIVQWHLRVDGKKYEPGDEIELTTAQAEWLGEVVQAK